MQQYPEQVKNLILLSPSAPAKLPFFDKNQPEQLLDSVSLRKVNQYSKEMSTRADSTKACWDFWAEFIKGYVSEDYFSRHIWGDVCNMPPTGWFHPFAFMPVNLLGDDWDIRNTLANVSCPVLILHGEDDTVPVGGARQWKEAMPKSRLIIFPNTGHFIHVEQANLFFPIVNHFLAGTLPDSISPSNASLLKPINKTKNDYTKSPGCNCQEKQTF